MISNVKTNIITGFLGVGKTTAITRLLQQRQAGERWAVLVNEFGEMGIDGHLLAGNEKVSDNAITVKQVPGGCICCAAGLPLQVAVNQLLKQTRPDRLIIEPSGMGHPRNILKSLTDENYDGVLDMRACLCLLDPKKLQDPRYIQSDLFVDQIDVADRVVANKTDLCDASDKQHFEDYIAQCSPEKLTGKLTGWISHGRIKSAWLDDVHQQPKQNGQLRLQQPTNNKLETGFNKLTLNFSPDNIFHQEKLADFLKAFKAERIKGIVHTDKGAVIVNMVDGALDIQPVEQASINRLEVISTGKYEVETVRRAMTEFIT